MALMGCLLSDWYSHCKWPSESLGKFTLRWRHNGHDGISNHQPHDCLLNRLFRRRSKKTSKLRVTGLCAGNSLWTGEFYAQMASNAENVSISWRHHDFRYSCNFSWVYSETQKQGSTVISEEVLPHLRSTPININVMCQGGPPLFDGLVQDCSNLNALAM